MQNLVDRVIEAAGALFAARGFGATSIRDIAAAVDAQPASLYSHFESKEAILARLVERGYAEGLTWTRGVLERHRDESCAAQLDALVRGYVERIHTAPAMTRYVNAELDRLPAPLAAPGQRLRTELWALVTDVIARGQAAGEFDAAGDPYLMMTAIRGIGAELAAAARPALDAGGADAAEACSRLALRIVGAVPTGAPR